MPQRWPSHWVFFETVPAPPISRLPLEKRSDGAKVSFVAKEIGFLLSLGPELDGVRQGLNCLPMPADEGASKVDVLEIVLLAL